LLSKKLSLTIYIYPSSPMLLCIMKSTYVILFGFCKVFSVCHLITVGLEDGLKFDTNPTFPANKVLLVWWKC